MAANVFQGTIDNNWGNSLNWSLLAVPTNADGNVATFNATSPNCTVNASARVCNGIDFTGYLNTITMTNQITVTGNITFKSGLLVSGTGGLLITGNGVITSNGFSWPNSFTFLGNTVVHTLADQMTVNGNTIINTTTASQISGSSVNKLVCNNGLTHAGASTASGNADIEIKGGTWVHTTANTLRNNVFLNGNVTISGTITCNTGTIKYTAGNIIATGTTLTMSISSGLDTSTGVTWNNFNVAGTITLGSDLYVTGNTTLTAAMTMNNNNFYLSGPSYTVNAGASAAGTTKLVLNGTTTASTVTAGSNYTGLAIDISTIGTITFGTNFSYNGTMTYLSGNVVTANNTLFLGASTMNVAPIKWWNVNYNVGAVTTTLSADLYINNSLSIGSGTAGNTLNGSKVYLSGDLNVNITTGNNAGTTEIVCVGNTNINSLLTTGTFRSPITFNTGGEINFPRTFRYQTGTMTYQRGMINAYNCLLTVPAATTFINIDNINFNTITLQSGQIMTLNKFFSGSATYPTTISASTLGSNYTITMQDGFEKIGKFIKIQNCTLTKTTASPGNVLIITDNSNKGGNIGLRYFNTSPNGISKNLSSLNNPFGLGCGGFLADPIKIRKY